MQDNMTENELTRLPLLPLRGMHVFPGMLQTFDVERNASIAALNMALKSDQLIFLATQKSLATDIPQENDIYHVGTVCRIRQQLRLPRGNVCRVMIEGLYRAEAAEINTEDTAYTATVFELPDKLDRTNAARKEALVRSCLSLFEE